MLITLTRVTTETVRLQSAELVQFFGEKDAVGLVTEADVLTAVNDGTLVDLIRDQMLDYWSESLWLGAEVTDEELTAAPTHPGDAP